MFRRRPPPDPSARHIAVEGGVLAATPHAGVVDDEVARLLAWAWPALAAVAHESWPHVGVGLVTVPADTGPEAPPDGAFGLARRLGFVPATALAASPFAPRAWPPGAARRPPEGIAALDAWLVAACERYDVARAAVVRLHRPTGPLGLVVESPTLPPPAAARRLRALFN